jgi:hypothetical protein
MPRIYVPLPYRLGRPKNYQRVHLLLQAGQCVDRIKLDVLIGQHALQEHRQLYKARYE